MNQSNRSASLHEYLRASDHALSRTARTGNASTGVHFAKKPSLLSGDRLFEALDQNRAMAAAFIDWQRGRIPDNAIEINAVLIGLAWIANFRVMEGQLYRAWPYVTPGAGPNSVLKPIPPDGISVGLANLAEECAAAMCYDAKARARAIARIEWEIGIGPLHPFYDGCGRVSRYFSTMLCLWSSIMPPVHISREIYMSKATMGETAFVDYWVSAPSAFI